MAGEGDDVGKLGADEGDGTGERSGRRGLGGIFQ